MKPLFICDRIDAATLTASAGSDASYPLTNLKDGRYATQWKSGGTTDNQTLTIDYGASYHGMDSILICNHNLNSLGLTGLQLLDSSNALIKSITLTSNLIYAEWVEDFYNLVKLKFIKGSALSAAPQIGMIFLGQKIDLPGTVNNPKKGFATVTDMDESLSGLTFATQVTAGKYTRKFTPAGLTSAEETDFIRLLNTISNRLHPFFLRDTDGNWNFVRLGQDTVEWANRSEIVAYPDEISLIGELPGVQIIS
jgi:hypothetical protein